MSRKTRQPPRARAAVAELPRHPRGGLARFAPSSRSVVVGLGLAAVTALLYLGARESSVFAVRTIAVDGVPPKLARKVERALQPLEGESLLRVSGGDVTRLATALPQVAGVSYDRAFPNTLRVTVVPEVPLAVLRRGAGAWLVSRNGRVIARLTLGADRDLPRIWLPRTVDVILGGTLAPTSGADQIAALVPAQEAGLHGIVSVAIDRMGQITYVLRGGVQVRAGRPEKLALKLAIARRILAATPVAGYLDVSVPERPVALTNPQLSTGG